MGMRFTLQQLSCAVLLGSTALLLAQKPAPADQHFVVHSMQVNNGEIKLGHLALEKSQGQDVKHFAQRMIDDHTKLNQQMEGVAKELNITPPTGVPPADEALQEKLQPLSGAQFDKVYIRAMVLGHTKVVIETKQEATAGSNPQVKKAADRALPVLEQYLAMARQLAQDHHVPVKSLQKE